MSASPPLVIATAIAGGLVARCVVSNLLKCQRQRRRRQNLTGSELLEIRNAVTSGDVEVLEKIVKGRRFRNVQLLGPIIHNTVTSEDSIRMTNLLLCCGVDANVCVGGKALIHVICEKSSGYSAFLELLISRGANPNLPDTTNSSCTPLHLACTKGNIALVRILLKHPDINIDVVNDYGWHASHLAAATNRVQIMDLLKQRNVNFNVANKRGSTPLHLSCTAQSHAATKWLLKENADVAVCDNEMNTPLHFLMSSGVKQPILAELLQMMLDSGASTTARNRRLRTPLHNSLQKGHGRLSVILINEGADVAASDDQKVTAIHLVASCGDVGMLTHLLEVHPNAALFDSRNRTPLSVAAANGHYKVIDLLISVGVPLNTIDSNGHTPLLSALHNDRKKAALHILRAGADGSITDKDGNSPLAVALHQGPEHSSLSEELITKHKVSVKTCDSEGRTPLHWAAASGDCKMCTLLLEYGADVGAATKNVITPLHWAAGEGEIDATEMMIIEGVQTKGKDFVNIRDGEGRTPLHWALKHLHRNRSHYMRVCELLLEYGSELRVTDNGGDAYLDSLSEEAIERLEDAKDKASRTKQSNDNPFGTFTAFGTFGDGSDGDEDAGEGFP